MTPKNHYEFTCAECGKTGYRLNKQHPKYSKKFWSGKQFCDKTCSSNHCNKQTTEPCKWCQKPVTRTQGALNHYGRKTKNYFCNNSCSASYNNTQRRKSRRSKVETLLFELLSEEFLNLELLPNDKSMLDGLEVDIAIPTLNLAIEWNGIVHFKPIYGESKLQKIQSIDERKQILAVEKNINLIVIPDLVSTEAYVKEAFQKIKTIINDLIKGSDTTV